MGKRVTFIKSFFQSGTKESSIRLALIWTMVLTTILILTLSFIIIYMVMIDKSPDYSGMALLLGGWSTFAGVVIWGKIKQGGSEDYYIGNGHSRGNGYVGGGEYGNGDDYVINNGEIGTEPYGEIGTGPENVENSGVNVNIINVKKKSPPRGHVI